MNILIVDDHELQRKVLAARFKKHGHSSIEASDGVEAVDILKKGKIDAVISDILMPRMDGYELCQHVRTSLKTSLPIILYSAIYTSIDDEKTALSSGADLFLRKPVREEDILDALERLVTQKRENKRGQPKSEKSIPILKEYSVRLVEKLEENAAQLQAQKAEVEKSEERFRALVTTAAAAIIIYTPGEILFANPAASDFTGYENDELLRMKPIDLIFQDDRELAERRLFMGHTMVEISSRIELRIAHKSGKIRWLDFSAGSIEFGRRQAVIGTAFEVTSRKQAELSMRESEERLKTIINAEPECVKITDRDGVIRAMNPAGLAMLEADREDMIVGRSVKTVIVPEFHEAYDNLTKGVFNGSRDTLEFRVRGLKGTERWLETHSVPLRNEHKEIVEMLSVTRDITGRKKAEEQLKEQAALLDVDPSGISVIDSQGRILFWNKGAERLYGWTREQVVGTQIKDRLSPELHTVYEEARTVVLQTGRWQGHWIHRREGKPDLVIESEWTLVRDNKENPKFIYVVDSDITERTKLQNQLIHAQRMESLGMIAGGIAHELNNVLGPILLSLQILGKQATDDRTRKLLRMIESSATRGSEIVRQILGFARATDAKTTSFDPAQLIKEIELLIQQTFPRNIEVKTKLEPDIWSVLGSTTSLHQVLLNLCVNARDAMPQGGTLTLECENQVLDEHYARLNPHISPGPYVLIIVSDTGAGIPPELLKRIFEPFFTTKEAGKGTGLGLSLVAGIVQNHGGFVNAYSDPGKGTSFKVYLPAVRTREVEQIVKEKRILPRGNGEGILIIDDEPSILEISKDTLEAYGYEVLTASDGPEGIALYAEKQSRISLVLCDIAMPLMDGPTTIRALQKLNEKVNVVVVSGFSEGRRVVQGLGPTVRAFLPKPYSAETLVRTIRDALSP